MHQSTLLATILLLSGLQSFGMAADKVAEPMAKFNSKLAGYLTARRGEFDQIPAERKQDLQRVADYVRTQIKAGDPATLVFICTHNSRRSHMAQIWATDAATYYGLPGVQCFSGGTEGTAFNPRAVAALQRAGIEITKPAGDESQETAKNPRYQVQVADGVEPLISFSKKYRDPPNPTEKYCAVMTCSSADQACPTVVGSSLRVAITYDDPKMSDDTPQESATYDGRSAQICREMLYLFSQVGK